MAEVLGLVASGISVAQFAGSIVTTSLRVKALLEQVKDAPESLRNMLDHIELLTPILCEATTSNDEAADTNPPQSPATSHRQQAMQKALKACQAAGEQLELLARDLTSLIDAARGGVTRKRAVVKVVLKKGTLAQYQTRLQKTIQLLTLAQSTYVIASLRTQEEILSDQMFRIFGSPQCQSKDFISILDTDAEFQSLLDSAAKNRFITLPSFGQFSNIAFKQFGIEFLHENQKQPDVAAFLFRYSYVISSTLVLGTVQRADVTSPIKKGLMTERAEPGGDFAFDDTLPANWLLEVMAEKDTQFNQGRVEPHPSFFQPQDRVSSGVDADVVGAVNFKTADLQNLIISSHAFRSLCNRFKKFLHPDFFQAAMYFLSRFDIANMERYDANLRYRLTSLVVELSQLRPCKLEIDFHRGTTKLDAIKLATEEVTNMTWSWWPLRKPRRPLQAGQVRLSWICECGRKRSENVPQMFGTFLESLGRQQDTLGDPSGNDGESSQSRTKPTPTTEPKTSMQSQDANETEEQPTDVASNENATDTSNSHSLGGHGSREKWIFLMAKSDRLSLHQIDARMHSGDTFADALRKGYSRLRGWWRFRFGIDVFSHCDFVKFEKYVSERYSNRGIGVPDSEPHIKEYYFQPRPGDQWFAEPPISPEHFRHIFYECAGRNVSIIAQPLQDDGDRDDSVKSKAAKRLRSLFAPGHHGRFPPETVLRIPQRLSYFDEKGQNAEYLWGLLAREERSAIRVCLWAMAIFTPSIAFSFIYLFGFGGMDADLQNATSLFVISLTIFCTFISFLLKDGKRLNDRL